MNYEDHLEKARADFAAFLKNVSPDARCVAFHDSDADGLCAGVIWQRALERLDYKNVQRLIPDRERNAWTPNNRAKIEAAKPQALWVLDLGSKSEKVIADVPTCFVDHHHPEGCPPGDTLISAYNWEPIPNTSLMIYELTKPLVDVEDLNWIAAIGTLSDLGEKAPFEIIGEAKKQYKAKWLKEATTLVNASRRASTYEPETAAQALLNHTSPQALVESDSPEVARLKAAREEVKSALEEGKKAAPQFAGNVALIRVHSPCQIHPLIAQIWRTRLPKFIVIAANDAYMPGRVNFSARSAPGINVLQFLRAIELPEGEGNYGHGHDQASGGSLPLEAWNELLRKLGFN
ncbi:MAG TPA: DHH family phosphoesterase [Abditibacteriaceae bacterium]|jgi:single-stranded-DNA-specific exonuclease